MSLRLDGTMRDQIDAHLAHAYPEEGCGVLLGRDRDEERTVDRVIVLPNQRSDSRHHRYLISPEQFLAADQEARSSGLDVVGFFHSHPDHPPRPSQFDLDYAWPYYSYLIVSIERGRVAGAQSWRLAPDRSRFEPEAIERLPDLTQTGESH